MNFQIYIFYFFLYILYSIFYILYFIFIFLSILYYIFFYILYFLYYIFISLSTLYYIFFYILYFLIFLYFHILYFYILMFLCFIYFIILYFYILYFIFYFYILYSIFLYFHLFAIFYLHWLSITFLLEENRRKDFVNFSREKRISRSLVRLVCERETIDRNRGIDPRISRRYRRELDYKVRKCSTLHVTNRVTEESSAFPVSRSTLFPNFVVALDEFNRRSRYTAIEQPVSTSEKIVRKKKKKRKKCW